MTNTKLRKRKTPYHQYYLREGIVNTTTVGDKSHNRNNWEGVEVLYP